MSKIYFRLKYIVKSMELDSTKTIEWQSDVLAYPTKFLLRPLKEEELKPSFKKNDLICIIVSEEEMLTEDLAIYRAITDKIPSETRALIDSMLDHLSSYAQRTLDLFLWMRGATIYKPVRYFYGYSFSFDNETWKSLPEQVSFGPPLVSTLMSNTVSDTFSESVIQMVKQGVALPLSHSLYGEAWEQAFTNPRSSLVIAIAALETAVKHCLAQLHPMRVRSFKKNNVPLKKLIREELLKCKTKENIRGTVLPPPPTVIKSLEKGIQLRNKIVHGQGLPIPQETLHDILYAIRDVIYLIDHYCGFKWSADFIRLETKQALLKEAERINNHHRKCAE